MVRPGRAVRLPDARGEIHLLTPHLYALERSGGGRIRATWSSKFDFDRPGFDYFGAYFTLKEGLEEIFGRQGDVVSVTSIRNPYFRDEVMRTRELVYAA